MKTSTRSMLFAALFTALTAVGAFIKIPVPLYPVPMTLQTAFIFLAGLLLQKRAAFFSQATYVMLGLIGIPIFTGGGGIGYVLQPTFGYLIAFLICAPLMSMLAERTLYKNKKPAFIIGGLLLILLVQIIGASYMALISGAYLGTPLPFSRVAYLVLIFLPLDVVKLFLASALAINLRKRMPGVFVAGLSS